MSLRAQDALREVAERTARLTGREPPLREERGDAPAHPWCRAEGDLIFFRAPNGSATDAEVEAAYGAIHAWWAKRTRPACFVTDLSNTLAIPASQRKIAAEWEAKFRPYAARYGAAALVAPSAALRGIVTAVFWVSPPGYPYTIVSTQGAAVLWAQKHLRDRK